MFTWAAAAVRHFAEWHHYTMFDEGGFDGPELDDQLTNWCRERAHKMQTNKIDAAHEMEMRNRSRLLRSTLEEVRMSQYICPGCNVALVPSIRVISRCEWRGVQALGVAIALYTFNVYCTYPSTQWHNPPNVWSRSERYQFHSKKYALVSVFNRAGMVWMSITWHIRFYSITFFSILFVCVACVIDFDSTINE